jgi:dTMP kinase
VKRGLFITLEGIDGCGKTTQSQRLARSLEDRGLEVVLTRQPGGTRVGERVREILLANTSVGLVPLAEMLLYAADRAQHVNELIKPSLEAGRIVISDRYIDSTVAFQGYGRGLDLEMINKLNHLATSGLNPDLTILLSVTPEAARARFDSRHSKDDTHKGMTRFEEESMDFHERVRAGYESLAKTHPQRICVVDASGTREETQEKVIAVVMSRIDSNF